MSTAFSVIQVLIWLFILILRGWLCYKYSIKDVSIFQYIHNCYSLDIGVLKSLFCFKFFKNKLILNILTIIVFVLMILLIIDPFLV